MTQPQFHAVSINYEEARAECTCKWRGPVRGARWRVMEDVEAHYRESRGKRKAPEIPVKQFLKKSLHGQFMERHLLAI